MSAAAGFRLVSNSRAGRARSPSFPHAGAAVRAGLARFGFSSRLVGLAGPGAFVFLTVAV